MFRWPHSKQQRVSQFFDLEFCTKTYILHRKN